MNIFSKSLAVLATAAVVLSPGVAAADCVRADLAGKWQAYTTAFANGDVTWIRCRLDVAANGDVANTECLSPAGRAPLRNGELKLTFPTSCTFVGEFKVGRTLNRIIQGTIAADKLTAHGVGSIPRGGFTFTLVKII